MEIRLGEGLSARILTTGRETDGRHDLVDATMPPGAATPPHRHRRYAERLFVIDGELLATTEHGTRLLGPGDFLCIEAGTAHMLSTSHGARALNISSPAAFAELLIRTGTAVENGHPAPEFDPDVFAAVAEQMGDELLGPPGHWPTT